MNEREELANLAYLSGYPDPTSDRIQPLAERAKWEIDMHYQAADMILAAGYFKPRTITTTDEVDALPNLSVVMTCHGDAETIHRDVTNAAYHFLVLYGPATVLHEPEEA